MEGLYGASFKTISKGSLELRFSWLFFTTGFKANISKCWDTYVSRRSTICFFFCSFSPLSQHVDLVILRLVSKSTSVSLGFSVPRQRQYDTIFGSGISFLGSLLFSG